MKEIYKQAIRDYNELCDLAAKMSFMDLYKETNGFNLWEDEQFDCDFKSIRATVWNSENGNCVDKSVDIWNDAITEVVGHEVNIANLKKEMEMQNEI